MPIARKTPAAALSAAKPEKQIAKSATKPKRVLRQGSDREVVKAFGKK